MTDLVLLSGGMDSTTAMAEAAAGNTLGAALTVNYGQRHARELKAAIEVAGHYGATHYLLDLTSWGSLLAGSALTDNAVNVPHGHYADETMRATIVPNRNATLLMAAAGIALANGFDRVVTAVHAGDHPIYPDCRPAFVHAINAALALGTESDLEVVAPFARMTKTEIATYSRVVNAPLHLSWSCYEGGELHCGQCGTCVERIEAFRDAGIPDPTSYAAEATV
jgi:7-cyano-7-deazaguanine synthase